MPRLKAMLLSLATLSATAFAATANPARPGTLNYVEGQASIAGQSLNATSIGTTEMQADQPLETTNGKAEVLLTPGVFLRIGNNTSVRLISSGLTHTEIAIDRGEAEVEVDQLYKQNDIVIDQNNAQTKLLKQGLYDFDAQSADIRVFDGKAAVTIGGKVPITLKGGRELKLNGDAEASQKFDKKAAQDELYKWSSLRSQYLGEANVQLASQYAGVGGFAPGWFWNPYMVGYTWLPGDGYAWSPFGYGFYSPYYIYGGGYVYGTRGIYQGSGFGRGYASGRNGVQRPGGSFAHAGAFNHPGGFSGGGFHGGAPAGGGFHGGGGGHR